MGHTFAGQKKDTELHDRQQLPAEQMREAGTIPNSIIMRVMELPGAESEADRLSSGVKGSTPDAVRREMGGRLGADLSGIRFHRDASSSRTGDALGAEAWTQGRDVYFGSGGFTPSVAAHELVHTVQQGAAKGNTDVSMPYGSVQLKPKKEKPHKATAADFQQEEDQGPAAGDVGGLTQIENRVIQTLSSGRGLNVYNAIEPEIKKLVKKIGGKRHAKYTPRAGVSFMVRAAYQDYALRDILQELAGKSVGLWKTGKRITQYKALISGVDARLGDYQAEELAIQTGMLQGQPKYDHSNDETRNVDKRSYQLDPKDAQTDSFNPGNIPEIAKIQNEIDQATSLDEAYSTFAKFTGNRKAVVKYEKEEERGTYNVNLDLAKTKLKNMARMIWDYPELRNVIGDMEIFRKDHMAKMAVKNTFGGRRQTPVKYNAYYDREGDEAANSRAEDDKFRASTKRWNGDLDHAGNHELGHVLGSTMVSDNSSEEAATRSNVRKTTENKILKEVLLKKNILTPEQKKQIKFFNKDGTFKDELGYTRSYYKNQLDTKGSPALQDRNLTSFYGSSSPSEFFAEAFGDVYTHGSKAKPVSIEVVKEYEKLQKKEQRDKYDDKTLSTWGKIGKWFRNLF